MHTCIYAYIHTHTYILTFIHEHTLTYKHPNYIHTCLYTFIYSYTHINGPSNQRAVGPTGFQTCRTNGYIGPMGRWTITGCRIKGSSNHWAYKI